MVLAAPTAPCLTSSPDKSYGAPAEFFAALRAEMVADFPKWVDADKAAPLHLTGRRTAAAIAGADLKVYEGAPHGLFTIHAARLNTEILAHIA